MMGNRDVATTVCGDGGAACGGDKSQNQIAEGKPQAGLKEGGI